VITAINPGTLGIEPPLAEYIALAERYSFGGIEFNIDRVIDLSKQSTWHEVRGLFELHGVSPAIFGLPIDWRKSDEAFSEGFSRLKTYANAAAQIGCTRTGTWLPPAIDGSTDEFAAVIARRFRAVADVLADYNISLALEFVGPDTCRIGPKAHGKNPFIYTLGQTIDLIEEIDAPGNNIGLLIDSFHWYTSHGTVENILALASDQVIHVHINDAPDVPINEQLDFERLLPGDGIINLTSFLKTLAYIGYAGFVAVETFNKDLAALGADGAAARTEVAVERLLSGL
jgi:sugar phosphate isomerase/epimerase